MIKLSTGLTSIPISNVPGSEDVEINYMEAEDAEASNSGGFNQLDISSFFKELEVEKDMNKKAYFSLRKKADDSGQSIRSADFMTGDLAKSENLATIFSDIVSDLELSMQGFSSHSRMNLDQYRPGFLSDGKYNDAFNPDDWMLKFFRFAALNADFESGPGKSNHPERVPNIVKGWRALYLAGEQTGDAYENAMQDAFDYGSFSFLNLDDDMFHSLAGIANAMVRLKELKQEYNSVKVSGSQSSSANSSQSRGTPMEVEFLDFPIGTELKDIDGTNSYTILSASELIIKKDDGSSMTINPSNADKHSVNWSLLVQNLSDDTKTMLSGIEIEGSYKKDFNISKVSKNMKEELIKLNSVLNGLGYRNLVKLAASAEPDSSFMDLEVDKYYFYPDKEQIIYIEKKDKDRFEVVRWGFDKKYLPKADLLSINFYGFLEDKIFIKIKTNNINKLFRSKDYDEAISIYKALPESPKEEASTAGTYGSTSSTTPKKKAPVATWPEYINSTTDQDLRNKYNKIRILWQEYAGSNSDQVGHEYRMSFEAYKEWWKKKYGARKGSGGPNEVIQDLELEVSKLANPRDKSSATASPSAAPAGPASSAMSVTETVNGKASVSIGARGGDQIYLVLESVDKGEPVLYRKDNRTGQIKEMTSNEVIQFRNSLNDREIRRLEDAISRATGNPQKAEAFKRYMKLQRKDNRFGRIGGKRRKEKMEEQSEKIKSSSARQSRLDTLRKKGVI